MRKTIKDYKDEIRELKDRLNDTAGHIFELETELNHYRCYVRDKFEWYVQLTAKHQYPTMTQLVIDHAKFFNKRKSFDFNMLPRAF